MKRAVKSSIAVCFAIIMCLFGGTSAFAYNVNTRVQSIEIKNAPDGTAFADILVKKRWHDKYAVDFNDENAQLLGVNGECGLAKYAEDGFTSMLLYHNCAVFDEADISERSSVIFTLNVENNELFNHFRKIKVAYCDKFGNVLGVTETAKFEFEWLGTPAVYYIQANGDSLACKVSKGPPYYLLFFLLLGSVLLVMIIFVLVGKRILRRRETSEMIERIQSGVVDDERKE